MSKPYEIMGVINANEDSFFEGSRFKDKNAIVRLESMITEGADIIDIGGVSSRPGAIKVSEEEELIRLKPILDAIYTQKLYEKVQLSLDSYSPLCLSYALERGFHIVNDIHGLEDDEVCKLAQKYKAKVVIMHMQGEPEFMQDKPCYDNLLEEVKTFFQERIDKAQAYGIKDIVLDVGIGFGKSLEDNLTLIKEMDSFKDLNRPLLIGASRKSMINALSPSSSQERLGGTLAIHLKAYDNGAQIIRCHDVKEHVQAFKVHQAFS